MQGTIKWADVCIMIGPSYKYEHREEEMTLVIQAQGVLFSTMDTIHRNPINAKAQVVLDLVNPIDVWNL